MIWFLWEIIVNILTVSAECFLLYKHLGMRYADRKIYYGGVALVICIISAVNYLDVNLSVPVAEGFTLYLTRLIMTALLVAFSFVFCGGNSSEKIMWSFVPLLILAIGDMIPFVLFASASQPLDAAQYGMFRFVLTAIHTVIVVAACLLLARTTKHKLYIPMKLRFTLIAILILGTVSVDIMVDNIALYADDTVFQYSIGELALILTFLAITISLFALVTRVGVLSNENMEYALDAQQKALEQKAMENMDVAIDQLRELRHEMKNACVVMDGLLLNREYDDLHEYFSALHGQMHQATDMAITNNSTLNSLLYSKILLMESEQIAFHYQIGILDNFAICTFDLCSILGNLLDNAIEASRKLPDISSRYIRLHIKNHENIMLIKVENSYNGVVKKIGRNRYLSTKAEGEHSLGLRHVEKVIASYQGHLRIMPKDTAFEVAVLLPYLQNGGER